MKTTFTALAMALAATSMAVPATAAAQDQAEAYSPEFSKDGREALAALQTALTEERLSEVPGLIAAAEAAASTPDDRYTLNQLRLNYGVAQDDPALMYEALKGMRDSNSPQIDRVRLANQFLSVSDAAYRIPNYTLAAQVARDTLAADANNDQAVLLLTDSLYKGGDPSTAFATYRTYIDQRRNAGGAVPQEWYQRAVGMAYNDKLPGMMPLAISWVAEYPTDANWREVSILLQDSREWTDAEIIDVLRFQRVANQLPNAGDYAYLADQLLSVWGFPGEALAVIEEGIERGVVDASNTTYAEIRTIASRRIDEDRAGLDSVDTAIADTRLSSALASADAYYGYGQYADAARIYTALLSRDGADTNVINLRLGMAAGMAGDMATANAALDAVEGNYADLAQVWKVWLQSRG